jgi:Family of unknown function (DUF6152)
MKLRIAIATFALGFAASVMPVAAHHSVPETFDISKEITIGGVVTKIEWTNPHARFWVDARNDDGTVSNWELELPPPNALKRSLGLDFIKPGDQVTVVLWRAKDGSTLANVLDVVVPDGRVFNFNRSTTTNWGMTASSK